MIPSDLAARLRLINEASFFETEPPLPGLQRVREIQSRLPELVPGQRFFATLQRTLPDGSFQAVVAGKELTLALNTAAKSGDTLELEVSQVTPRAVFARVVGGEAAVAANASAQTALSQTGKLISFLLTGQPAPSPASLAGNRPLLDAPPGTGSQLVPVLRQALGQSGLFYESHQVQWVLGKLDTAALLREPQGQQSAAAAGNAAGANAPQASSPAGGIGANAATQGAAAAPDTAAARAGTARIDAATATRAGSEVAVGHAGAADAESTQASAARIAAADASAARAPIPERLMPVVHQQLDALATQQYVWQGQAWPGQTVEWLIEDPQHEGDGDGSEAAAPTWNTTLRLTLPRLGGVEAQLHLTPAGVALRLRADDDTTIQTLDGGAVALASALEAVGLKLTGLVVERRNG
jgi:hypothetical protein